jgi:propanediol dehydratase small subunit|tara:strand:- start:360 stop:533 length:174 start_codon:yes stop_codon:yes gene_type:complete
MKKPKGSKQSHTPNSKYPRADEHGTGIKQKMGRTLDSSMTLKSAVSKHLGKPPKSLA